MEQNTRIIGASALLRSAVELDEAAFLAEVQAESIGWLPLGDGAYLHLGNVIGVRFQLNVISY